MKLTDIDYGENNQEHFEEIQSTLDGLEGFNIQTDIFIESNRINISLKFDNVIIENNNGEEKQIGGIEAIITTYLIHRNGLLGLRFEKMRVRRHCFNNAMLNKNYIHSHVEPGKFNMRKPCFGDATDLHYTYLDLCDNNEILNPKKLESLLISLRDFFEWESLEGGPHIHMSEIRNDSSYIPSFSVNDKEQFIYDFYNFMLKNEEKLAKIFQHKIRINQDVHIHQSLYDEISVSFLNSILENENHFFNPNNIDINTAILSVICLNIDGEIFSLNMNRNSLSKDELYDKAMFNIGCVPIRKENDEIKLPEIANNNNRERGHYEFTKNAEKILEKETSKFLKKGIKENTERHSLSVDQIITRATSN